MEGPAAAVGLILLAFFSLMVSIGAFPDFDDSWPVMGAFSALMVCAVLIAIGAATALTLRGGGMAPGRIAAIGFACGFFVPPAILLLG